MNPSMALLLEPPFQWWVFLVVTVLNVLLTLTGFISKTISWSIGGLVNEVVLLSTARSSQETLEAAAEAAKGADQDDLGAKRTFGRVIGLLERQIYLYAFIASVNTLLTAVLVFKAFSGWLKLSDIQAGPSGGENTESTARWRGTTTTNSASRAKSSSPEGESKGLRTLARYYAYAIGNFMSLAWAILIFEGIRLALRALPQLQSLLLITTP